MTMKTMITTAALAAALLSGLATNAFATGDITDCSSDAYQGTRPWCLDGGNPPADPSFWSAKRSHVSETAAQYRHGRRG
jgi:hypothetical protein